MYIYILSIAAAILNFHDSTEEYIKFLDTQQEINELYSWTGK